MKICVYNLQSLNKFAVFLQLLLRLFQTGSGRYKRYMLLPVLRECINNAENVAVLDFSLFYVTIWTSSAIFYTTLSDYSDFKI